LHDKAATRRCCVNRVAAVDSICRELD
jgi:hypothetical protein